MNLLLIAPGASSTDVGESLVAYRIAEHLAAHFEVTLITWDKIGRPSVIDDSLFSAVIRFQESPGFHRFERFNSMAKPWYPRFFRQARQWIKSRLDSGTRYDWAHQVNPCAIRYPSPVVGLGIPYSLGPVAGGLPDIESFTKELDSASWYTKLRTMDGVLPKLVPYLDKTYREASLVFAAAPYVSDILKHRFDIPSQRIRIIDELGVFEVNEERAPREDDGPVRLLYVGRVVRTKGARDLIRALSLLPTEPVMHLDLIGDGDDLPACRELAIQLGVEDRVTFHGKLPRPQVDAFYRAADIFTFPSFREPTGGVLVEAMSYGLPMVVADYGGPQSIVQDSFGIKVTPDNLENFAQGIAEAVATLAADPDGRETMREAALEYCRANYIWDRKIGAVAEHIKSAR
jgi:glycosyltransferase involved in cell wall biosynthesis